MNEFNPATNVLYDTIYEPDGVKRLIAAAPSGKDISDACDSIKEMLLRKNIAYGNSALNPARVFSKATTEEQLLVRIDDKITRIQNGTSFDGDNDVDDLVGYLILLKVARKNAAKS